MDWHPIQGGVEILLVASCQRNQNKVGPDEPLGLYADFRNALKAFSFKKRPSLNQRSQQDLKDAYIVLSTFDMSP